MKDADKTQRIHPLQNGSDTTPFSPTEEKTQVNSVRLLSFLNEYHEKSKSVLTAYLFLLIFPWMPYGYLGRWKTQAIYWLTLFGCGIWLIVLLFRLPDMIHDYNNQLLIRLLKESPAKRQAA